MSKVTGGNHAVYMGGGDLQAIRRANEENPAEARSGQEHKKTIFAGAMNGDFDPISHRKAQMKKQAMKVVMDQFETDGVTDTKQRESRDRIAELKEVASEANRQAQETARRQDEITGAYGVKPGSQEAQDLELIRRARQAMKGEENLTPEEWEQVAGMGEPTEYQRRMLELDEVRERYQDTVDNAGDEITQLSGEVTDTRLAMLKSHGMTDALKQKDSMMEAASKEALGMLMDEAKDKFDEKWEEMVEHAKEKAEKEAEEEEKKAEKEQEEKQQEEALREASGQGASESASVPAPAAPPQQAEMLDMTSKQEKVQQEVEKIVQEAALLLEDVKGIAVDRMI